MNTQTDKKKIEISAARAQLSDELMAYNTTHLKRAQLKHWTYGKEHKPIADEIIVEEDDKRTRVIFGVEYDDQGYIGAVYKTDIKGKRTNLTLTTDTNTTEKDNNMIAQRIDAVKKEAQQARAQAKTEEKAPTKTTAKRVVKRTPQAMQTERRA